MDEEMIPVEEQPAWAAQINEPATKDGRETPDQSVAERMVQPKTMSRTKNRHGGGSKSKRRSGNKQNPLPQEGVAIQTKRPKQTVRYIKDDANGLLAFAEWLKMANIRRS